MRIYLIGMRGSGKSTLGKELANKLNYRFIDMDSYIEEKYKMTISHIFEKYGETMFRQLETSTLEDFERMDNVVVATGGGVIKNKKHKSIMTGKCIYLAVPAEELEKRLEGDTTRPLLKTRSVREILEERIPLYEYFADLTITNVNMEESISKILEVL